MDTARKRGDTAPVGGLTKTDHAKILTNANIAQRQLEALTPYFDELQAHLHQKWESLPLDDGAGAKTIKFELYAVKKLREIMIKKVNHGKQSAKKIGA